jgi:alkanesulfonate monooxygenase SsuD/methylene tetrahydromethanopterin reductase-like flavin-dependent oxidoreductase (luciferase family)
MADGWFPFTVTAEEFADKAEVVRAVAAANGREPGAIEMTAWPGSADPGAERSLPWVRRYVDAGASRLVLHAGISRPDELHLLRDQLNRYQDEVGSQF